MKTETFMWFSCIATDAANGSATKMEPLPREVPSHQRGADMEVLRSSVGEGVSLAAAEIMLERRVTLNAAPREA